ncbi:hypothetical protein FUT87_22030 [Mitsuaria sp. TWR114]|nr:hypothetical protein FUT87_22030 [Mitsuaria sp. TWR114]
MRTRRFNAIRRVDEVYEPIDAALLPLGFTRTGNVYHRQSEHDVFPGIEAVTFGFDYGFRTCWMHTTVKIPALIELLAEVRPFAYAKRSPGGCPITPAMWPACSGCRRWRGRRTRRCRRGFAGETTAACNGCVACPRRRSATPWPRWSGSSRCPPCGNA